MLKNAKIRTILFTAISAAVLSACGGGGSSPSAELVNNATSTRSVLDQIQNLPAADALTVNDKTAIENALAAYNNLKSQSLVSKADLDRLKTLIDTYNNNVELANGISTQIAELPLEIAKTDESTVSAVRNNYEALSDGQKTWLSNNLLNKLVAAETTISENKQLAEEMDSAIAALPSEIAKDDAAKVVAARKSLTGLTEAQKSWVKADSVNALAIAELIVASNQEKAQKVAKQIAVLPENGLDVDTDEKIAAFTAAKKAFDDLSESEKTWVDTAATTKLAQVSAKMVIDSKETSLAAVNEPAPLPTSFLTLQVNEKAQQFNPNMQLRSNSSILDNQTALIHEIAVGDDSATVSEQDKIGVLGISFREDDNEIGNPDNTIQLIGKVKSQDIVTPNDKAEIQEVLNNANEIVYRQDADKTVFDKKWDGVYAVKTTNGAVIVMRDPAAIGWNYQTFAYYKDLANNIAHAYQSIGTETPANAMPTSGTATYHGLTTAQYVVGGQAKQMSADVKAIADFGKKLIRLETGNTYLHNLNSDGARVSTANADLNIKGSASWAEGNQFKGTAATTNGMAGNLNGKFYGANAAEIGGTYGLKNAANTEQLIGGYGAKRQ